MARVRVTPWERSAAMRWWHWNGSVMVRHRARLLPVAVVASATVAEVPGCSRWVVAARGRGVCIGPTVVGSVGECCVVVQGTIEGRIDEQQAG